MWNLINPNNGVVVVDFWNGEMDFTGYLESWANNEKIPAGRYILVGKKNVNAGSVIFVDVSDFKLEGEVRVGSRVIFPDENFSNCLVVNGAIISLSFTGQMIKTIAEYNPDVELEFASFNRNTLESVQIKYFPGGIIKKVKTYRVV